MMPFQGDFNEPLMSKIIIFFIALAFAIYLVGRPVAPEHVERDPSSLALEKKIDECSRIYGDENTRKNTFAKCQGSCSKGTDDKIRTCIDACQATADQFSNCASQAVLPR
jgi:hypothetical protein